MGLVGMGDCNSTGTTGCKAKRCVPPPTVDVVVVYSDDEEAPGLLSKRYRLKRIDNDLVWTGSLEGFTPAYPVTGEEDDGEIHTGGEVPGSVAYSKNSRGGFLASFVNVDGAELSESHTYVLDCNLGSGEPNDDLATVTPVTEFTPSSGNDKFGFQNLGQECASFAAGRVGGDFSVSPAPILVRGSFSTSLENSVERWNLHFPTPSSAGEFAGSARVNERLYTATNGSLSFDGNTAWMSTSGPPSIIRSEIYDAVSTDEAVVWLDLSTKFTRIDWMLADEERERFWLIGTDAEDEFYILAYIPWSATLPSHLEIAGTIEETGLRGGALTLVSDSVWFITDTPTDNDPTRAYQFPFSDETLDLYLERTAGEWPLSFGVGDAFIVGPADNCIETCFCEEEPTPAIELTRVFEDDPGGEGALCEEDPPPVDWDGYDVAEYSCLFLFDYEITLCAGRTLAEIVFQGTRGTVFVNDLAVHLIDDWSELPLTGQIRFTFGNQEACGPKSGTVRITLIDSAGCCHREIVPIDCCLCCPPAGNVTFSNSLGPPPTGSGLEGEDATVWSWGDFYSCIEGVWTTGGSAMVAHSVNYMKLTVSEPTVTDCGEGFTPENTGYYAIDWGIAQPREGAGALPDCMYPGDEVEFMFDLGALGGGLCITVTPFDALGCAGEPEHFWIKGGRSLAEEPCYVPLLCPDEV